MLMFVPEGSSPDDKVAFGMWVDDALVGLLDLPLRYPDEERSTSGCCWSTTPARARGSGRS